MHVADLGARCNDHMGEAFRVRCIACDTLQAEYGALARFGMTLCPNHPAHFRPCEKGCDN